VTLLKLPVAHEEQAVAVELEALAKVPKGQA
jgi:hypothetical protein